MRIIVLCVVLSSLNLAKYNEWKNTNLIYDSIWFLDGVMEEFIQRAKGLKGFENAVRSAEKGRAIGLGVLGWHTYLQQKGIPFEGLLAQYETRRIFSQIKIESERASMALAESLVNRCGVLALVCVILTYELLLLLLVIKT
jgi:ribonucleoside-diphosphate reductase alpha chain